jgi:hypothetical protein
MLNTTKTRGSSKLFKGSNETALVTYREDGMTKTAVFRNDGCQERAAAKAKRLSNVVSITVSRKAE